MARILFAWELGDNYGHLLRFRDLILALVADGHDVVFYVKRLDLARRIYGSHAVRLEPIPHYEAPRQRSVRFESFADILLGTALHDVAAARERVRRWQQVIDEERPAVILFDFSPNAMLANRACRIPAIACGNSFYNPPPVTPLPPYRSWLRHDLAALQDRDMELLAKLNQARPDGTPAFDRAADLFATDRTLLHTFPEFDLFRGATGREYVGAFPPEDYGVAPYWPDVSGPRVFAYLQPSENSRRLLAALGNREISAVAHCPGLASHGPPLPASPKIHYATEPISIAQVARQCQLAITNGNLTTIAGLLLAGKPQLLLPYTLEKNLTARCVELLGAGLAVAARDPLLETKLDAVLQQRAYARGAEAFAARYAHLSLATQVQTLRQAIADLID